MRADGRRRETTDDRCPYCGSDYSVTLAGAVQVDEVWHDERGVSDVRAAVPAGLIERR